MPPTFIWADTAATPARATRSAFSTAFASAPAKVSRCSTPRAARSRPASKAGRRGTRTKSRNPIPRPRPRRFALRSPSLGRRTWPSSSSARMKAPIARPGRNSISATAIRWTCWVRRKLWSGPSSRPASPRWCSCINGRPLSINYVEGARSRDSRRLVSGRTRRNGRRQRAVR